MLDWVWDRLYAAIIAPVGPETYFEEEDTHNPYRDLKQLHFPSARRLDDSEEAARAQSLSQSVSYNPSRSLQTDPLQPTQQTQTREPVENSFHSGNSLSRPSPNQGRQAVEHFQPSSHSGQISSSSPEEYYV